MDDREHEEILYRLDERTKRVDDHLSWLDERLEKAEEEIDYIDDRVDENENTIKTATKAATTVGGLVTAGVGVLFTKLFGLL